MANREQMMPFEFDSRMVEWNLKHKNLTQDQLKTYLASLPDEIANSEPLRIEGEEEGAMEDGDDSSSDSSDI